MRRSRLSVPLKRGFWEDDTYHFYTASSSDGMTFVQVADALDNRTEAVREGSMALFLPVLVLIPVSILLIFLIVRRALVPVEDLRAAIEERTAAIWRRFQPACCHGNCSRSPVP